MSVTICQLCKEPVWNFVCIECISQNIRDWLPQVHLRGYEEFHKLFSEQFQYESENFRDNTCLQCRSLIRNPICPYCYTNEVFLWLKDRDSKLASLFTDVFNFDFEDSGHKEFHSLESFSPVQEEDSEILDEGLCEVCECYSGELKEVEGRWVCEYCKE